MRAMFAEAFFFFSLSVLQLSEARVRVYNETNVVLISS